LLKTARCTLDDAVLEVFSASNKRNREKPIFTHLADNPFEAGDTIQRDHVGPEFQLQRDCSEQTACEMDEEVKKLLDRCYAEAKEILSLHRDQHEQITADLLRYETVDGPRFYQLIGREMPRPKELVPPTVLAAAVGEPQRGVRVNIDTDRLQS